MLKRWAIAGMLGLALVGCNAMKKADEEKEEGNAVKVAIEQVPAAVRATLQQEAPGVAITTVDKEEEDGKVTYEADAMIGGQNYEIKVAPDGKLISKKVDNEAEEKKGEEKEGKK